MFEVLNSQTLALYLGEAKARRARGLPDRNPHGLVFGFLFRFVSAFLAVLISAVPTFILGMLNEYRLSGPILIFYAISVSLIIYFGEHLRSRIFERVTVGTDKIDVNADNKKPEEESDIEYYQHDFQLSYDSSPKQTVSKRFIDVMLASSALVLAFPVMIIIAAMIKFESPGPVLVTQKRIGHGRREFRMYKFRTREKMREVGRARPYLTQTGAFLAATSLDQLPQIINVLKGDMSILGPVPLPPYESSRLPISFVNQYVKSKPGLYDDRLLLSRSMRFGFRVSAYLEQSRREKIKLSDRIRALTLRIISLTKRMLKI